MMINNTKINVSFIIEKVSLNKNGTLQEYDYWVLKKRAFWSKNPRTPAQWGFILSQPNIYSLIKQVPTFHDATTGFSIKKCQRTFAEIQFWWGLTTSQIWVVFWLAEKLLNPLLNPFRSTTQFWVVMCHKNGISALFPQKLFLPENQWWHLKMLAVFTRYLTHAAHMQIVYWMRLCYVCCQFVKLKWYKLFFRVTRGARNLQVAITHALHVCSHLRLDFL